MYHEMKLKIRLKQQVIIQVNIKKKIIKIKFDSSYNLPLNRILKLHTLTIVVRSVFQEVSKYYPKYFLDECLYEL